MSWFYGLKIRTKFFIPIAILSLLMLAVSLLAINRFKVIDQKVVELRDVNLLALSYLMTADTEIHKAITEERSMIFLNVESPEFEVSFARHQQSVKDAHAQLELFHSLMNTSSVESLYLDYVDARDHWEKLTLQVALERKSNTRISRTTAIELSFKDANEAFVQLRQTILALIDAVNHQATKSVTASRETVDQSRRLIIFLVILGGVISTVMFLITPRLVVAPIQKMTALMQALAHGDGDLSHKIIVQHGDELGELGHAINAFIESLRLLLVRVVDIGQRFDSQTNNLHGLANTNNELAQSQYREVEQATDALNALSHSVNSIADLANNASGMAQTARSYSHEGNGIVTNTMAAIDKLAKEVQVSSAAVLKLSEDSGNIASVVNVIKGIAEQINLLALNAAIEAARAGEQGRGFAVVADSVRELAFKTAESTHEIQSMIAVLQESAVRAANAMQNNKNIAHQSVAEANLAGDALMRIDQAIVEMAKLNTQIVAASQDQTHTCTQINRSTGNISGATQQSAALTLRVEESAQLLATGAGDLEQALRKFKL